MLTSSPFKPITCQSERKTAENSEFNCREKVEQNTILQNANETVNSLKVLLAYACHLMVALFPHTWDKVGV